MTSSKKILKSRAASVPMAVAFHARERMIEALRFKPADIAQGGWDGAYTLGKNVRSYTRGNVGIVEVNGMLWTHDDIVAYYYGLTTYESMALEVGRMIEEESIDGLILAANSPGGHMAGCMEFTEAIFAAREILPLGVFTHVMGEASSAAYIIGSAGNQVIIEPAAMLGSVGAVMGVYKEDPEAETIEFVSSISPLKRANPESKEGASEYQSTVDAVGQVIVEAVAKNRGISAEKVVKDFGRGGELVGQQAINAGMADHIGSLEEVITAMRQATTGSKPNQNEESTMAFNLTKKEKPAAAASTQEPVAGVSQADADAAQAQAQAQAVTAERTRVSGIVEALNGTALEGKTSEYIASGATLDQVNSDLVASFKTPAPAPPVVEPTAAEAAAKTAADAKKKDTLEAMRQESERAKEVEAGSGGTTTDEEKKQAVVAYNKHWATGAQSAIARGGARK